MADLGTMTGTAEPGSGTNESNGRRVSRARGLPRGRAVVGALLVAASAVAVFAAYLDARGGPAVSYLVADGPIEPGTRFADRDEMLAALSAAPIDLVPELAERAIPVDEADQLVGWLVVAPLERGDLLTRSAIVPDGDVADAQTMSFALPRSAAVGGSLRAGERIDVLATYGSGGSAYTAYVVRGVPLLQVTAADGGTLGGGGEVTLTVAVSALGDVQALGHAVNTASVFVARSSADGGGQRAPGAYVPEPTDEGPAQDLPGADEGDEP